MGHWDFLSAAYIITLDTATHRHATSKAELERVGLLPLTTYFYARPHPNGGKQGCFESHRYVLQAAAARQPRKPVLIMEDDVQFTADWQQHLRHAAQFVHDARGEAWDMLLLGFLPLKTQRVNNHIQRVQCGALMHAYIVHPAALRALQSWMPMYQEQHVDHVLLCNQCSWKKLFQPHQTCMSSTPVLRVYALKPMIAMQRHDRTSTAAQSTKFVTRALANVRLMRTLATTSTNVSTPTFITYMTILLAVLILGILVTVIVVPVVVTQQQRNRL